MQPGHHHRTIMRPRIFRKVVIKSCGVIRLSIWSLFSLTMKPNNNFQCIAQLSPSKWEYDRTRHVDPFDLQPAKVTLNNPWPSDRLKTPTWIHQKQKAINNYIITLHRSNATRCYRSQINGTLTTTGSVHGDVYVQFKIGCDCKWFLLKYQEDGQWLGFVYCTDGTRIIFIFFSILVLVWDWMRPLDLRMTSANLSLKDKQPNRQTATTSVSEYKTFSYILVRRKY